MRFADTNVLLYAVSRDPQERHKAERARGILAERDLALSVLVLQEFYVQATREGRSDPSPSSMRRSSSSLLRFPLADVTRQVVLAAIAARHRFRISYWDAAILEAARSIGCDTVLSEDLNDGQDYGGVRVQNPFR